MFLFGEQNGTNQTKTGKTSTTDLVTLNLIFVKKFPVKLPETFICT